MKEKVNNKKPWFSMAVSLCIAVLFYFILSNLDTFWSIICTIAYYIYPVIAGVILAYLINPLMKVFENKIFGKTKKGIRRALSLTVSIVIVLLAIGGVIMILVPTLYDSVLSIYANKDSYITQITDLLNNLGAKSILTYFEEITSEQTSLFDTVIGYITNNGSSIKEGVMSVGGHVGAWVLGLIFAIYFLAGKDKMRDSSKKLLASFIKNEEKTEVVLGHITNIDEIVSKYLAFTIVDSILIGVATGIFMAIFGMEFTGLLAVIIGVTNLIPTFGPIIGTVVGAVLLLLSNPWDALWFVVFELVYQTLDGYVIRPKLFGKTLGVSGLAILIAIIVGGRILGVVGILLSIPVVAIGDYLIKRVYIPTRREKAKKEAEEKARLAKEEQDKATDIDKNM
ncbi:MAG: AI-2E family transporter [Lachnospiraceae bacterium]|nr:AI-2E family transporter [Lachnospiraceae bacterium]